MRVDRIENVDPQLLDIALRAALLELRHVDRLHQRLLRQFQAMLCCAADADPEHSGRTPSRAHRGDLRDHPVDDIVRRVHHLELGLVLAAAALGRDIDLHPLAWHHFDREHARCVVLGVATGEGGIGEDRSAQLVLGVGVAPPNPFIDDLLQTAPGLEPAILTPFDEDVGDAGVLADRPVPLGTHPAVGQDLCDRILRCGSLLGSIGIAQRTNVIHRVVVGYKLQRIGHAFDQVFFADRYHVAHRSSAPFCRFAVVLGGEFAIVKALGPMGCSA